MINFFDSPNYQQIEEDDYNISNIIFQNDIENQSNIYPNDISSFDYPDNNTYEYLFERNSNNNGIDNLYSQEKNFSSPNETDKIISQKNTSDKSTNNSNCISNEKDLKFNLNEVNEQESNSSIYQKAIDISSNNTQKGPFSITKERKLGRKTKNSCQKGAHDKYCYDNMTKKLKQLLMNSILNFVNTTIIKEEKETSAQKRKKNSKWKVNLTPCLVKIDQNIIGNIKVEYNISLLNLSLKEILSKDITSKIKKFDKDYNKKIIEEIYQKKQKEKTINILNMTLNQCINHLTNKEYYIELQGLEKEYENIINKLKNSGETDEYIELFKDLLGRFEEFYKNKRIKNGSKKEKNNEDKIS
jgi:hypothetical protein